MIKYSDRATLARGRLKQAYNDIEVYVEDTKNHNMWYFLIKSMLPEEVRFSSVNALGGRKSVIDACKNDQINDGRKKIYIIDSDFDILLGKKKEKLRHLYRLRAYCVENILLNDKAIIELCMESDMEVRIFDAIDRFPVSNIIQGAADRLRYLFCMYAAVLRLAPSVPTVSRGFRGLILQDGKSVEFSSIKIQRLMRQVARDALKHIDRTALFREIRELYRKSLSIPVGCFISGKDYLIPFVHLNAAKKFRLDCNLEGFKVRLARNWSPAAEPFFARRIRSLCS